EVGWGTDDITRENLLTVSTTGLTYANIAALGDIQALPSTSKVLVTKEYVDNMLGVQGGDMPSITRRPSSAQTLPNTGRLDVNWGNSILTDANFPIQINKAHIKAVDSGRYLITGIVNIKASTGADLKDEGHYELRIKQGTGSTVVYTTQSLVLTYPDLGGENEGVPFSVVVDLLANEYIVIDIGAVNTAYADSAQIETTSSLSVIALVGAKGNDGQGVPPGGDKDQILAKFSNSSFDTYWADPSGLGTFVAKAGDSMQGTLSMDYGKIIRWVTGETTFDASTLDQFGWRIRSGGTNYISMYSEPGHEGVGIMGPVANNYALNVTGKGRFTNDIMAYEDINHRAILSALDLEFVDTEDGIQATYAGGSISNGGYSVIRWAKSANNVGIGGVFDANYTLKVSGDTVFDGGTSSKVDVLCDDTGEATLNVMGGGQGTGILYVGQSPTYGGGIGYDGDGTPAHADFKSDHVTLYRRSNGTSEKVLWFLHNSDNIQTSGKLLHWDKASDSFKYEAPSHDYQYVQKQYVLDTIIPNTWRSIIAGGNPLADADTLELIGAGDISIAEDAGKVTISYTGTGGGGGGGDLNAACTYNNLSTSSVTSTSIEATDFILASDVRLKDNIDDLKAHKLRPVSFDWIDSKVSDIGFIAQEVEEFYPEVVTVTGDGFKKLSYSKITAINAARINELEDENSELKEKVELLEERLERLEVLMNNIL
ncbi:MAG: tail fiber domain-containing protein, partial [Chlamydiia bacterium]|nr:tail fiber domain-containing protein [Chlamydiia bacterium]